MRACRVPIVLLALTAGTVCLAAPEASIRGNSRLIPSGDITPKTEDRTDFGTIYLGAATVRAGFVLRNTGDENLTITGGTSSSPRFTVTRLNSSLSPGNSDNFTIEFEALELGVTTATISIANNDPDENPYTFTVKATVLPPPDIAVVCNETELPSGSGAAGNACTDFGSMDYDAGTSVSKTYSIENRGTSPLNITSYSVSNSSFVADGPTGSIGPGAAIPLEVTFDPQTVAVLDAQLLIMSDDPDEGSYRLELQGKGTGVLFPEISVRCLGRLIPDGHTSPSALDCTDYGSYWQGAPSIRTAFTLRNEGTADLRITSATSNLDRRFGIIDMPATVGAAREELFYIDYHPSVVGTHTATITIESNDGDENPYTFRVRGTTLPGPDIEVTCDDVVVPSGLASAALACTDFGEVDLDAGAVTKTFVIHNRGPNPLRIRSLWSETDISASPGSIPPDSSWPFTVAFDPEALGPQSWSVQILSDDPDEEEYRIELRGTGIGVLEPQIQVRCNLSPIQSGDAPPHPSGCLDFGAQLVTAGGNASSFFIQNQGRAPLNILSATSSTPQFVITGIQSSISPGLSDLFFISFDPDSFGAHSATITIQSNDPDHPTFTFAVTGIGTREISDYHITVSNGPSLRIANAKGSPAGTRGSMELGYFRSLDDTRLMLSTPAILRADWHVFHSPALPVTLPGHLGTFQAVIPGEVLSGSEFAGKEIYVAVGDGPGLTHSREVHIFKTGAMFGDTDPGSTTDLTLALDAVSQVVYGSIRAGELVLPPFPTHGIPGEIRPLGLEIGLAGKRPRLQWQARSNRDYQVEWTPNLTTPWQERNGGFLRGLDAFLTWLEPAAAGDTGFYRVVERER